MSTPTDSASALACLNSLRAIRDLRSRIASELAGAAVHAPPDSDLAACVEYVLSWLGDGDATMQGALREAEAEMSRADEDEYERRVVVTHAG